MRSIYAHQQKLNFDRLDNMPIANAKVSHAQQLGALIAFACDVTAQS